MGHNSVYRVTRNPQEFRGLMGCQRDPEFRASHLHPEHVIKTVMVFSRRYIKVGVKVNEVKEERCPKSSPLTLVGVFKALVESQEEERK